MTSSCKHHVRVWQLSTQLIYDGTDNNIWYWCDTCLLLPLFKGPHRYICTIGNYSRQCDTFKYGFLTNIPFFQILSPSDEAETPQFPLPGRHGGPQAIRYNILAGLHKIQQRVVALEAILSDMTVSYQDDPTPTTSHDLAIMNLEEKSTPITDLVINSHGSTGGDDGDTTQTPTSALVPNSSGTANSEAHLLTTSVYSITNSESESYTTPLSAAAGTESGYSIQPLVTSMAITDGEKSILERSLRVARFKASDALVNYVSR